MTIKMRKVIVDIKDMNDSFESMSKKGIDTKAMRVAAANMLFAIVKAGHEASQKDDVPLKFKQEQQRIGVYAGQTLAAILNGLDEADIDEQFTRLKVLMDEIEAKGRTGQTNSKVAGNESATDTNGQS